MDHRAQAMLLVGTARPEQALRFYRDVLGLALIEDSPFALVFETSARTLRVQKMAAVEPSPGTVLGWRVEDTLGKGVGNYHSALFMSSNSTKKSMFCIVSRKRPRQR